MKYTIKEGEHDSGLHFGLVFGDTIRFRAKLSESCLYSVDQWLETDKKDLNKLAGFSNGFNHEINSARIGWRCKNNDCFEITTYIHDNGNFIPGSETVLGIVYPEEWFNCSIQNIGYSYRFGFNGFFLNVSKQTKPNFFKYRLYPYFGGNHVAPQDISIYLE